MIYNSVVWALIIQGFIILVSSAFGYFLFGERGSVYGYLLFNFISIALTILLLPAFLGATPS